ncbi:MAG: ABC transporter permease [Candidatus Kuenenia sp.]|nr:ABC transporter permease [Candidatus Kuenenia hertensis]
MFKYFEKPYAFICRDFLNQSSYKISFVMQFTGIFISVVTFFFLSELLGGVALPHLQTYGGNYFAFVIIGVALSSYLGVAMNTLSQTIREGQMLGTLEAMLVTHTGITTIIISSSLYSFVFTSIKVALYLLLGVFLFGLDIGNANLLAAFLIFLLTIIAFSSLGILSASFVMVLKKGDPISWVISSTFGVLGGVYYPISILPGWLQKASYFLPVTHALEGMRLALLKGYSFGALSQNIIVLIVFSIIMLPGSVCAFGYAVRKAKIDGTLTQY